MRIPSAVILSILFLAACNGTPRKPVAEAQIEDLLSEVRLAFAAITTRLSQEVRGDGPIELTPVLKLKEAKIVATTKTVLTRNGTIKLFVFSGGETTAAAAGDYLQLTLTEKELEKINEDILDSYTGDSLSRLYGDSESFYRPIRVNDDSPLQAYLADIDCSPVEPANDGDIRDRPFWRQLADSAIAGIDGYVCAALDKDQNPSGLPFDMAGLEVNVSFEVVQKTEGGVAVEFAVGSIGGGGSRQQTASNTITMTFVRPKAPAEADEG